MRPLKLYEHPEFKREESDISLLHTICFVLTLALLGATLVLSVSCLLLWDDCKTSYPIYSARPHLLTVRQVLNGSAAVRL
ncbi:hypothetical protein BD309DRAFT_866152 [Dichomitus squalens]|uniref:Uncharacterized protein n=1 Tax=Dichomitus squalens TaxID=114155 RepID=A0A4Q9QE52_9APHY|nr:uncharacterized protein DICSQDRAFT_48890 [Dichomitus squalens LYAD-421 SS1]EJF65626.1 hypothetical protein DICSQDRAFT_48890 [Dichomitus squalens LYAD-421 SS1]TBU32232.1 hypothetical protein BD311DRAFT_24645 [Dichomitus squalens]TBU42502.1 hypothetical protein BD309DRAFT_866152 [Dichomitus squalens]TBU66112.1 hypothetical protein BD310DRAFT_943570 [Dichomitus squalens]